MVPPASSLPPELTSLPNWVGWRYETREGSSKPTKVPYNLSTGHKAANNNPSHWVDYPDPSSVPDAYNGVGFVFTKTAGFTGVDLDDCLTDSGSVKPWAAEILRQLPSYAEISPSGTGIKVWVRAHIPGAGLKAFIDVDGNRTVESMKDGSIEIYDTGRYFAVTGNLWGSGSHIAELQEEITNLYNRLRGDSNPDQRPYTPGTYASDRQPRLPEGGAVTEGSRHHFLLSAAAKWRDSGMDPSALMAGLRSLNASRCSPPKPEQELKGIVDWLAQKPPRYRLTPADFSASARYVERGPVNGHAADNSAADHGTFTPPVTQVAGNTLTDPVPEPATEQSSHLPPLDILDHAENLLNAAITAKDPMLVLGAGTQPSDLILALAQAGSIKQYEAKGRIRKAFKAADVSLREFDARLRAAIDDLKPKAGCSPYLLTSEGGMLANLANAITMLQEIPLRYNSFTCRPFLESASPWGTTGDWTDYDDVKAAEWCQRRNLNVTRTTAADAADAVARSRPHFHPVLEYWNSLAWDGIGRIDEWLSDYLGTDSTAYTRAVGSKWLMSACKRIVDPNTPGDRGEHWNQADYTLVLEGVQGRKKSTALRSLCPRWFSDDIGKEIGTPDSALGLQGKLIVEIAELSAFRRADWETVKAWLVRREDHFRRPYGRRSEDFPRQNIFAASTNKTDWLTDDTGGRRFWPVRVGDIDSKGLFEAAPQLWAEAFHRFKSGETTWLSDAMESTAGDEQSERQDVDLWTDTVEAWLEKPVPRDAGTPMRSTAGQIYLTEVLCHCLKLDEKSLSGLQKARVGRILRLAGYETKRAPRDRNDPAAKRPEYWVPGHRQGNQ